jgi:shikimate kinase
MEGNAMNGYYDYHPTHKLYRPLAIVGFVNAVTRKVAHHLSSVSGLPAIHLDDLIQHELGASTHELIVKRGLKEWREAENRALGKAISSSPPSIISLGEGAVDHFDDVSLVLDWTHMIYLHLPLEEAIQLAGRQNAVHGATLWAEVQARGRSWDESMRSLYYDRHFNYRMAPQVIDVTHQNINDVTHQILATLPHLESEAAMAC